MMCNNNLGLIGLNNAKLNLLVKCKPDIFEIDGIIADIDNKKANDWEDNSAITIIFILLPANISLFAASI